eukprot:TRINITY_DN7396_c0_g1_i1.p1 TRINITY_DN7396_c0_g1~~TRINITY_DN7396_c0_g1_i1.p1  ORF type:complete len:316 (+),score=61.51 TRINITY_DN7396_c0_g1_i1:83-949(+)
MAGFAIFLQHGEQTHCLELSPDALVSDVMEEAERLTQIPRELQKVMFRGEMLDAPDAALADVGVGAQATVEVAQSREQHFDTTERRRGIGTTFAFDGAAVSNAKSGEHGGLHDHFWAGAMSELPLGKGSLLQAAFRVDVLNDHPGNRHFAVGLLSEESNDLLVKFNSAPPRAAPGAPQPQAARLVRFSLLCGHTGVGAFWRSSGGGHVFEQALSDEGLAPQEKLDGLRIAVRLDRDAGKAAILTRQGPRGEVVTVTDDISVTVSPDVPIYAVAFCQCNRVRILLRGHI